MRQQKGIRFCYMGGVGKIHCEDCGHSKKVSSSIHGLIIPGSNEFGSATGYQCLTCGKFAMISHENIDGVMSGEIKCKCSGELSRDHVLFCPKCKSKNLSYVMEYIT
jgi:DNA-directed RNA polymerase subunit RPC12/RpoP